MVKNFKRVINQINKPMIKEWVEDLVLEKTFVGLKFQEAILKKVAEIKKTNYRLSNSKEESKGIDGFVGNVPVSIKPITYKTKDALSEEIKVKIIFYEKVKDGLNIDLDKVLK